MRPRSSRFVLLAVALMVQACGSPSVTQPPRTPEPVASPSTILATNPSSGPPGPGSFTRGSATDPWAPAAVAQPSAVSAAPSLQPGYFCDPCHGLAETDFLGVASTPLGLIAVGVQEPPAEAIAFVSTDGTRWAAAPGFAGGAGSTAIAVTSDGRRTVAVGLDHDGAVAWVEDGGTWRRSPEQAALQVDQAAGGMTSVVAFEGGFVAGGYRDDPVHDRASAAVWRSADGLTWRLDGTGALFAGDRIHGLATRGGTIVAVGTVGDPNYGPAAAWRWTVAGGWQRSRIGPDTGGAMLAVTATPLGFVAVGLDAHDDGARAWTSADGVDWTAAPDQPAFHYARLPVRMQAVAASPRGLIAGGWRSDQGKGSAVTWTSSDGVTWQGPVWEAAFSGAEVTGVALASGSPVLVGRIGYPDWDQAAAWTAPLP